MSWSGLRLFRLTAQGSNNCRGCWILVKIGGVVPPAPNAGVCVSVSLCRSGSKSGGLDRLKQRRRRSERGDEKEM